MSALQEAAEPADITEMHAGEYDQAAIDQFTIGNQEHIAMQETMELLNIDGLNIRFRKH